MQKLVQIATDEHPAVSADGFPSIPVRYAPPEAEVVLFIRQNGLSPWIDTACQLVGRYFRAPSGIMIEKKEDPDFQDEWVSLRADAVGSIDEILDAYDAFTKEMVAVVPDGISSKIRLSLGAG